jgi:HK97 family phage major capsid protein
MSFQNGPDTLALTPDKHGDIFFQPLQAASTALTVTQNVFSESKTYRVPVVNDTPSASWTPEGAEIVVSDPTVSEVAVTPTKLAALTYVSRELADDSADQAIGIVANGMVADVAAKTDQAFFTSLPAPAPDGIADLTGVQSVALSGEFANIDAFAEALSLAETVGAVITSYVASPPTVLKLSTLKEGTGSNRPLLGSDPTLPTRRVIAGVPLYSNRFVPEGTVWAIPRSAAVTVLRTPAELAISQDAAFSSDRIAVRITQRLGFLFPHPAAIVKITETAG